MAKTVFYSFHYQRDMYRVQLVQKIGALEGQPVLNAQEWETIEGRGRKAVQNWIDDQMKYKRAVIVLIGAETAQRPWVKYEIEKAWAEDKPLLGVRVHGISAMGAVDVEGANPFDTADVPSYLIPVFDPTQRDWSGNIDSQATYNHLTANLEAWSEQGARA